MSGIFGLTPPSYLPTLFASSTPGDSLLATLYGYGGATSGTVNPIAALQQAESGETKQVALVAAEPQVKRDIAQFVQGSRLAGSLQYSVCCLVHFNAHHALNDILAQTCVDLPWCSHNPVSV